MQKSTRKRPASKPARSSGFPLWKHPSGRWCKESKGRFHYFGKVADDPDGQAALLLREAREDYFLAGLAPPDDTDGLTGRDLVNRFLTSKQHKADRAEITARTELLRLASHP